MIPFYEIGGALQSMASRHKKRTGIMVKLTVAERLPIEVEISPDGKVSLKTRASGPSCFEETASLEKALGKVTRREKSAGTKLEGPGPAPERAPSSER